LLFLSFFNISKYSIVIYLLYIKSSPSTTPGLIC
jgi:hypothetical protein